VNFIKLCVAVFALASVGYLFVAGGYWAQGRPGLTFAFVSYVLSNCGFIYDMLTYSK